MLYDELYGFDRDYRQRYGDMLCGIDEAGRGPLAGPVCCAAVILKPDTRFDGLTDSKKVSESNRERLYKEITEKCVCCSAVFVDNNTIDSINILNATMEGMFKAASALCVVPDCILIDGNRVPEQLRSNAFSVIKGDAKSASVAAASIIAKVTRDRYMKELALKYPQYGFEKHKGYPTKAHYEAIKRYGTCEYHRMSFLKGLSYEK